MKLTEVNYEKIITFFLITVIAVVPLLYFPYSGEADLYPAGFKTRLLIRDDNIYKPKIYAVFYLVLIMAVIMALKSRYKKKNFSADINNISVTLFLIFTILSTFFSEHIWQALQVGRLDYVYFLCTYIYCGRLFYRKKEVFKEYYKIFIHIGFDFISIWTTAVLRFGFYKKRTDQGKLAKGLCNIR